MAWELLFTSDIGLFSLFVIAFTTGMAIYYARYFSKKMDEKPQGEKGTQRSCRGAGTALLRSLFSRG